MRCTSPAGEKKAGTAFRRGSLRNLAQSGKGKGKEHGIRPKQREIGGERAKTRQRNEKKSHGGSATHSSKFHQPYIRSRPGVEEEHEPRQKSSKARADRQRRQAGIRINGNGRKASASRRLPENCVKTASHEMLMSGG